MWWPFRSAPKAPVVVTADRDAVVVALRKDWLAGMNDAAAARLLRTLSGEGDGDWGGADYPEIGISPDAAVAIVEAVHIALVRSIGQ